MRLASNKHSFGSRVQIFLMAKATHTKHIHKGHLYDKQHRQAEVSNTIRNIMQKELSKCNLPIFFY